MRSYEAVVRALERVLTAGKSLSVTDLDPLDREITFGVLRHYYELDFISERLLQKPIAAKHSDIHSLILAGLYSVKYLKRPTHASVNLCVETTLLLRKGWAKGLVNALLRGYLRDASACDSACSSDPAARWNHPLWLIRAIETSWPDQASSILSRNVERPPMTLRVNLARQSRDQYLHQLLDAGITAQAGVLSASAIVLDTPCTVGDLPGFAQGLVSVQDEASQLAVAILKPVSADRFLDACAAPGGKACHILESAPGIALIANDRDPKRLQVMEDNMRRVGLQCKVTNEDLRSISGSFNKILLDAPCSATGTIRRHPDIKMLRREEDIAKLAAVQSALLQAAWTCLEAGGELLYATCSVLPDENENVVSRFLQLNADAQAIPLSIDVGIATGIGRQLLPDSHDGFYYAHLRKLKTTV